MNATRYIVTALLAICFASLPFAAMTTIDVQNHQTHLAGLRPQAGAARLAFAQKHVDSRLNLFGCG
jgi:hypothetical protein